MSEDRLRLREPVDVPDLLKRDALVQRMRKARAIAAQARDDFAHWNVTHPDEEPFDIAYFDAVIAWYDGKGPYPEEPPA